MMLIINSNNTIGNRTRDLPACSSVPQPTAPPRAPNTTTTTTNNNNNNNNNNYNKYFTGEITLHVAQTVNTEQLQRYIT